MMIEEKENKKGIGGTKVAGYMTASSLSYGFLKQCVAENKRWETVAEKKLWKELNTNRYKIKFRRQHIIGDFIADFVCLQAKLVIEVDGAYHAEIQQRLDDENRTKDLNNLGFTVVRYTNEQVMADTKGVAEEIFDRVFSLSPLG